MPLLFYCEELYYGERKPIKRSGKTFKRRLGLAGLEDCTAIKSVRSDYS